MMYKNLRMIVAQDLNGGIGADNNLLMHLPGDMKFFKETTTGHSVIMGRKTYESIGRLLPNRENIILTRGELQVEEPGLVRQSISDVLDMVGKNPNKTYFVIGGAEIYKAFLPYTSVLHRTLICEMFDKADTFFPSEKEWEWERAEGECHRDEKSGVTYIFQTLHKR